jgi:hypothetical protein
MSQATEFLSPTHKVLRFLERSRILWKRKHHELKMRIKLANNQVRAVEKSRQMWRERAEAAQAELRQLKAKKNIVRGEAS